MNEHRIRFEGTSADALTVATVIADADGVDLTASEPPTALAGGKVRLDFTVEGPNESIAATVDQISAFLPVHSSIELDPG